MKSYTSSKDSVAHVIFGSVAVVAVIVAVILGLVTYGLWTLANNWTRMGVNWWAVIVTLLVVPIFFFGFYLGKTEARGMLAGFDKSLDRMGRLISDVVTVRDTSRINVHNATKVPPPGYTINLPNVPRSMPIISHRELTSSDNVIDDL
jgi:hypothetical protein